MPNLAFRQLSRFSAFLEFWIQKLWKMSSTFYRKWKWTNCVLYADSRESIRALFKNGVTFSKFSQTTWASLRSWSDWFTEWCVKEILRKLKLVGTTMNMVEAILYIFFIWACSENNKLWTFMSVIYKISQKSVNVAMGYEWLKMVKITDFCDFQSI